MGYQYLSLGSEVQRIIAPLIFPLMIRRFMPKCSS